MGMDVQTVWMIGPDLFFLETVDFVAYFYTINFSVTSGLSFCRIYYNERLGSK